MIDETPANRQPPPALAGGSGGRSQREIADALGIDHATVGRDLRPVGEDAPPTPEPEPEPEPEPAPKAKSEPPPDTEWTRERQAESERYAARENLRRVVDDGSVAEPAEAQPHAGRHHYARCGAWRALNVAECPACPPRCECGVWSP